VTIPDRRNHGDELTQSLGTDAPSALHRAQRGRRLRTGIIASLFGRGAAALMPLILIPITLHYLGSEVFGLWMVATSLTSVALWADFGLGNGLMTRLTHCFARGNWEAARRYVSTSYAVLALIAAMFCVILLLVSPVVSWPGLLGAKDYHLSQLAREISLVCIAAFLVNMPLALIQRIQYAYQRTGQSNLWQLAGSFLAIAGASLTVSLDASPVVVVAAVALGPLLGNVATSAWVFTHWGRDLRPRASSIDRSTVRSMIVIGFSFFLVTTLTSTALSLDNFLVAHVMGLTDVTAYSLPARVFGALGLLVTILNAPLWPANGEAIARGDFAWVRNMTARMTLTSCVGVLVPALLFVILGDRMLNLWLPGNFEASPHLLLALAGWWVLLAAVSPRFMVQNSVAVVRPQLLGWSIFLVVSIPVKLWALSRFGLAGLPIAGSALYVLTVLPAAQVGYRRVIGRHLRPRKVEFVS
jgi:O-antigen/teichoic acid export membrane protein